MKNVVFIKTCIILCMMSTLVVAEESTHNLRFGISALIQDAHFDFQFPLWISTKTTLAPSFYFLYSEDSGKDLGLGIVINRYLKMKKVSPYLGIRIGSLSYLPDDGEKLTDWVIGASYGLEYFFDNNLSIGIEAQGNFAISDKESSRFGNPEGLNFNTGTVMIANIYF